MNEANADPMSPIHKAKWGTMAVQPPILRHQRNCLRIDYTGRGFQRHLLRRPRPVVKIVVCPRPRLLMWGRRRIVVALVCAVSLFSAVLTVPTTLRRREELGERRVLFHRSHRLAHRKPPRHVPHMVSSVHVNSARGFHDHPDIIARHNGEA